MRKENRESYRARKRKKQPGRGKRERVEEREKKKERESLPSTIEKKRMKKWKF